MAPPQGGAFDFALIAGGKAAPLKFAFTPYQTTPPKVQLVSNPDLNVVPPAAVGYRSNGQEWLWR
jgi:hypothetical protein